MKFRPVVEFSISNQLKKIGVTYQFQPEVKRIFFTAFCPGIKIYQNVLQHCAHNKTGLKTYCSHTLKAYRISPRVKSSTVFKTKAKSTQGEISLLVERVTPYKCFFIDKDNFTPGQNLTCDGALKEAIQNQVPGIILRSI